jgi:hypothetical protein
MILRHDDSDTMTHTASKLEDLMAKYQEPKIQKSSMALLKFAPPPVCCLMRLFAVVGHP